MGQNNGPYVAEFPVGSLVHIADTDALTSFIVSWQFHHPLQISQLAFAGRAAVVKSVGYYHGGDELYELDGIPGIWHEENLKSQSGASGA